MLRLAFAAALALLWPATGLALTLTYQTSLSGGAEFPANASPGTGTSTVVLDTTAHTLQVDVSFSGLEGTTTVAHIHCCVSPSAPVPTAGVATPTPSFPGFPANVTSGTYSQLFDLTQASSWNAAFITANAGTPAGAEAALTAALAAGEAYMNVHSSMYGGGEIRGFFVPEPTTGALLGAGIAALSGMPRRRAA